MSNPHSLPLSSMPSETSKTETQNTDDNETGLAVTSTTISYSPQPNNISRPEFAVCMEGYRNHRKQYRASE